MIPPDFFVLHWHRLQAAKFDAVICGGSIVGEDAKWGKHFQAGVGRDVVALEFL